MATPDETSIDETSIALRVAELQPTRDAMADAMLDYLRAHAAKILEVGDTRDANREARAIGAKAEPKPAPLPPEGVAATVGLGKSHAVVEVVEGAHAQGLPVVILVPNHKLAAEHAERLERLGAVVYQGRRAPIEGRPGDAPVDPGAHACYRMAPVSKAGDHNHRPAQGLCRQCPSGHAGVLKFVTRDEMRRERAEQFFKTSGIDPETVPPCQFLYRGLPDQLAAQVLIAPVQAFSDAMAVWREVDPESGQTLRETQRLIIVDEHIQLSTEIEIGAGDIKVWRNRLDALVEQVDRQITALQSKDSPTQDEADELASAQAMHDLTPEIDAIFRNLAAKIAGDIPIGADADRIIDLQKQVATAGAFIGGTASWEKVAYLRDDDDFFIPLRALATLASNCKAGSTRQEKSALFAYETSPIIEWARDRGSVMFLDATMSQTMRQFITALGGHVHEAAASQNMHITRMIGRLYSRGDVQKADYPDKARARMQEIREQIAPKLGTPGAIITHKAYLKYSIDAHQSEDAADVAAWDFEEATGVPIGWFGKHDRGLDAWGGRNLAIVGMPLLSKESIAGAYACVRAAMIDCRIPLPEWDQVMDKEKADADGPPMPVMPEVRAWLLDEYAQGLTQAIGRNRAVNRPSDATPLRVTLWGGLQTPEMDAALRRYGVSIHDRAHNPNSVPGPKPDLGAVDEAIEMVLATGGSVSERCVRSALVGLRRSAATESIRARIRELRAAGTIPPATRVRRDDAAMEVATEVKTETVAAAPADTQVEAAAAAAVADTQGADAAVNVEAKVGVTIDSDPEIVDFSSVTTAPNSYKETNSGNSAQSFREVAPNPEPGLFFAPAVSPRPAFAAGVCPPPAFAAAVPAPASAASAVPAHGDELAMPPDDAIAEMLLELAAEIEAELAQGDDDPDDDDDPHDPGPHDPSPRGPGGGRRPPDRTGLADHPGHPSASAGHPSASAWRAGAASAHIPYNNPSGAGLHGAQLNR